MRIRQRTASIGTIRVLRFVLPLNIIFFIGLPIFVYKSGSNQLAQYDNIMQNGVLTDAKIVSKTTYGSKSTHYVLGYKINPGKGVDETEYKSNVDDVTWTTTNIGATLQARYLPTSMYAVEAGQTQLVDSVAGHEAEKTILVSKILMVIFPISAVFILVQMRKIKVA